MFSICDCHIYSIIVIVNNVGKVINSLAIGNMNIQLDKNIHVVCNYLKQPLLLHF